MCIRDRCDALQAFGETFMPGTVAKLELYRGERPIFDPVSYTHLDVYKRQFWYRPPK